MHRFWSAFIGSVTASSVLLAGAVREPAASEGAAPEKKASAPLEGEWDLRECDNSGHTIGYHPDVKVSPGYALLMCAYMAKYPDKGSEVKGMRWRFVRDKLKVEWILEKDRKESRAPVAEFTFRLDATDKPWTMDLTWQPPGFEGMVREEKGQIVVGIYQKDGDRLEVVLNHSGKARPLAFKADRSRYRLIFHKVSP
jgi:uncharacterized protein (TIGR03067 family)